MLSNINSQSLPDCKRLLNKLQSMKSACNHIEPFSREFIRAKKKAFERYKKVYPIEQKQNIYEVGKIPYIGFYVMKGYRPELNQIKEKQQITSTCSTNIIDNMMKKYLKRKEIVVRHQDNVLPKVNQPFSKCIPTYYRSKPFFNIKKQCDTKRTKTQSDNRTTSIKAYIQQT